MNKLRGQDDSSTHFLSQTSVLMSRSRALLSVCVKHTKPYKLFRNHINQRETGSEANYNKVSKTASEDIQEQ